MTYSGESVAMAQMHDLHHGPHHCQFQPLYVSYHHTHNRHNNINHLNRKHNIFVI